MPDQELWRGQKAPGPDDEPPRRDSWPGPPAWLVPAAALVAAVLLLVALVLVVLTGRQDLALRDLAAGNCLTSSDVRATGRTIQDVARVDCAEPHDAEVYAVLDGAGAAAAACVEELGALGTSLPALAEDGLEVRPLTPVDDSDGPVVCLVRPSDGRPRTGSAFD